VDFDLDGITDIISGSYDPGDIYLFRGLGKGQYAAIEPVLDSAGLNLVHHPDEFARYQKHEAEEEKRSAQRAELAKADSEKESGDDRGTDAVAESGPPAEEEYTDEDAIQDRVASFGSWPDAVDWDGDGDLDLLIGSFGGEIWLRMNAGTRTKPEFSPVSIPVTGSDGPLKVHGHADPVAADWDRDGLWDLVVGSDVGAVVWFRNTGTPNEPRFASPIELIPPVAEIKFLEQKLKVGDTPVPGARKQICVIDYNRDGWLDLVAGDHSDLRWLKELDEDEQAERDADQKAIEELAAELKPLGYEGEEGEKRQQLMIRLFELDEAYNKNYYTETGIGSFVWLYLRDPAATAGDSIEGSSPSG
jgi:FG-GAP-like repeat